MPSIDVSKITELLGNYHRQKYRDIVTKFRENLSLSSVFPVLSMVRDELVVTEAIATEVMQPYQSEFTPKGELKFTPEILKTRYAKADISLDPNVFRATHLADFLETATSEEHELVRLAYNEYLKRAASDTTRAVIAGTYKAPSSGTAGKAIDSCDGFLTFIAKAITATKITPTTTGDITSENILEQVEAIYMSIPEDMRTGDLRCYMSNNLRRMYFQALRDALGTNSDYRGWDGMVDATEIPVVGLPYMGSSNRIVFSFHGNLRQIQLNPADLFRFDAQKDGRKINFMMDWSLGFGAMICGLEGGTTEDQYIWCNDVDAPSMASASHVTEPVSNPTPEEATEDESEAGEDPAEGNE